MGERIVVDSDAWTGFDRSHEKLMQRLRYGPGARALKFALSDISQAHFRTLFGAAVLIIFFNILIFIVLPEELWLHEFTCQDQNLYSARKMKMYSGSSAGCSSHTIYAVFYFLLVVYSIRQSLKLSSTASIIYYNKTEYYISMYCFGIFIFFSTFFVLAGVENKDDWPNFILIVFFQLFGLTGILALPDFLYFRRCRQRRRRYLKRCPP